MAYCVNLWAQIEVFFPPFKYIYKAVKYANS